MARGTLTLPYCIDENAETMGDALGFDLDEGERIIGQLFKAEGETEWLGERAYIALLNLIQKYGEDLTLNHVIFAFIAMGVRIQEGMAPPNTTIMIPLPMMGDEDQEGDEHET